MCCCGSRCTVIYTAIYTLSQSLAWTILAFMGIALYDCGIDISEDNPTYYLYFVYFFNTECAKIPDKLNISSRFCDYIKDKFNRTCQDFNILIPEGTLPPDITYPPIWASTLPTLPEWPDKFQLSEETHTFVIVYIVLSLIWAASAIVLLVSGIFVIRNYLMFVPWILCSIAVIVFDIYAVSIYANQAMDSETVQDLLHLIGVDDIPTFEGFSPDELLKDADEFAKIPAIVMAILAGRGGIIFLKNVLMLIGMFFVARSFVRKKDLDESEISLSSYESAVSKAKVL